MKSMTISTWLTSSIMGATLLITGCQSMAAGKISSDVAQSTPMTQSVTLDLKAGQVLQFAMPQPRSGDAAAIARQAYFRDAISLAASFGDEQLGMLQVTDTIYGEEKPTALIFYAFPDWASRREFEAHPDWPGYKAQRPDGWDALMIYSYTVSEDLKLEFNPEKHYTMLIAWTNPDGANDYAAYLEGIETDFERVGARFMHQFKGLGYETNNDPNANAPNQLTLVEWDTYEGLQNMVGGDVYKANAGNFQRGVAEIKLYRLAVPPAP